MCWHLSVVSLNSLHSTLFALMVCFVFYFCFIWKAERQSVTKREERISICWFAPQMFTAVRLSQSKVGSLKPCLGVFHMAERTQESDTLSEAPGPGIYRRMDPKQRSQALNQEPWDGLCASQEISYLMGPPPAPLHLILNNYFIKLSSIVHFHMPSAFRSSSSFYSQ